MRKYNISWKGRILGTYSVEEIRSMVASGKIGLMYMAEISPNSSIFVRDLLLDAAGIPIQENDAASSPSLEPSGVSASQYSQADVGGAGSGSFEDIDASLKSDVKPVHGNGKFSQPIKIKSRQKNALAVLQNSAVFIYALCGAAFLSPYLYVAALLFSVLVYTKVSKEEAYKIAGLSTAMCVLGIFFFQFVLPTLAE